MVCDYDWVLIVDVDEFVNVKVGDGIVQVLCDVCGLVDVIFILWWLMGLCGEKYFDFD